MVSRLNGSPLLLSNVVPFFFFPVRIKVGRLDPDPGLPNLVESVFELNAKHRVKDCIQ